MTEENGDSARAASLVKTLCKFEGEGVTLRFKDTPQVPDGKYDGYSYEKKELATGSIDAKITTALLEDNERTLTCHGKIDVEELENIGMDPSAVCTDPLDGSPQYAGFDVWASRETSSSSNLKIRDAKKAIRSGRQEEVLPAWKGLPTLVVMVERTPECHRKYMESDLHVQYDSPQHEVSDIIDVKLRK